jgi:tetratricopeptide (TPR) repeat protein
MLDVWMALLQQPAAAPDMATLALTDVGRIARDRQASATVKAKAACVRGLALRQQGRKEEAKAVLIEALKNAPADADWEAVARAALEEKHQSVSSAASFDVNAGNPLLAESAYNEGVRQFWAGAYARGEQRFLQAIRYDSHDARYYYYLGLCRWAQDKRGAARRDFQRGAELERQERPARPAVDAALERIQGSLREEVDQFRR